METVVQWLESVGLGQYGAAFVESDIDLAVLTDLTDEDLEKLGMSLGDRKRLLRAIARSAPPADPPALPLRTGPAAVASGAQRRHVTAMFCDLVNSTSLSGRIDPEDLHEILARYHKCAAETVARFGGFVAKYMGDGVLVYFGYPQAHEDDAVHAIRAALALIEAVRRLSAPEPLQIRIGIATGLVVIGDLIGEGSAQEQAIVGGTPNLAARLQAVAEPDSAVIAASTRRLVGRLFEYRDLGQLRLEGFAEPLPAFQVLGATAVESRYEARQDGRLGPLVGRGEELKLLLRRWRQARAGACQVVLISGEPGIGKSRLLKELAESVGPEARCLRYQCAPLQIDTPLYPLLQHMRRAYRFEPGDTPELRRQKLATVLDPLFPDDPDVVARVFALLAPASPARDAEAEPPAARRQRTFELLIAPLLRMAARQPLLLLFEDLQWADPSTVQVIRLGIERLASCPVLVAISSREPFAADWFVGPHAGAVALVRLDADQSVALVRNITSATLDATTVRQIAERGDGIPLFLEEMTKCVVEARSLPRRRPETVGAAAPLPDSLQASLSSRLDHLGPVKGIAQIGAVIGREFSPALLADVLERDPEELAPALERLVQSGLVAARGHGGNVRLWYNHALVHEAAYNSLLLAERKRLHGRVLDSYEKLFPGQLDPLAQVLAPHAIQAERWDKAAHYLGLAYADAVARSANREAISIFNRAVEVLGRLPRELAAPRAIDLRLHAFTAFHTVGENDKLVALIREAEQLAELIGDRRRLAAASAQISFALWLEGRHDEAQARAEAALKLAQLPKDFPIVVASLFNLANIRHAQGEIGEAVALHRRVLAMLTGDLARKRLGWQAPPAVFARAFVSWSLLELGDFAAALDMLDGAEPLLSEPDPHGRVMIDTGRGNWLLRQGEFARAAEVLEATLRLSREAEVLTMYPIVAAWYGRALCGAGRRDQAIAVLTDAVQRETYKLQGKYTWIHLRLALAEACRLTGRLDQAAAEAALGARIAQDCGEIVHHAYAMAEQGRVALAQHDARAALKLAETALAVARPRGLRPLAADCLRLHAEARHAAGEDAAAAVAREEARSIYAALGVDEARFQAWSADGSNRTTSRSASSG